MKLLLLIALFLFYLSATYAEEISVEVVKANTKILPAPDIKEVPLAEGKIGDVYKVIEVKDSWYRVSVEIEAGFTIEGWINKSDVKIKKSQTKKTEAPKPKEVKKKTKKEEKKIESKSEKKIEIEKEIQDKTSEEELIFDNETDRTDDLSIAKKDEIKKKKRGKVGLVGGAEKESFRIDEPEMTEPTITTSLPYAILLGIYADYYYNLSRKNDLGVELAYNYSRYNYTPLENEESLGGKIKSSLHNILFNLKYSYSIIPHDKNLSLIPKVGVRYLNFVTEDVKDADTSERTFYFVNSTYLALNLSPAEIEYVLPFFGKAADLGLRARWDLVLLTKYSEDKFDINDDGTLEGVTGAVSKPESLNHVIGGELFVNLGQKFYIETGYETYRFKVKFTGDGFRANATIKDASLSENYSNIKFSLGYRF